MNGWEGWAVWWRFGFFEFYPKRRDALASASSVADDAEVVPVRVAVKCQGCGLWSDSPLWESAEYGCKGAHFVNLKPEIRTRSKVSRCKASSAAFQGGGKK
jgi:hypothetical protein